MASKKPAARHASPARAPRPTLSPSQEAALGNLRHALQVGAIVHLSGEVGRGKTTVLEALAQTNGGVLLNARDFVDAIEKHRSHAIEESVYAAVRAALRRHPLVLIDDFHLLDLGGCWHLYPRYGYLKPVALALCALAQSAGRHLVFATTGSLPDTATHRSHIVSLHRFTPEDYHALARNWLGPDAARLDFIKIFRFAPKLNGHQLRAACAWVSHGTGPTTEAFIDFLRTRKLTSNVDLGEVQPVALSELKGVDDVLRSLEINIVLPLEHEALAQELDLRPKRGVLLHGPPGTGKTTVGRALAHRLKGKFFLIDGTFIAGTQGFHERINEVFEAARDNAPSVIFVDDADALFEHGEERPLYRYLLTRLDGLESESSARVCVMLTAMNVAHLPPALIRSGRVELWLEMRLPDAAARAAIAGAFTARLPHDLQPRTPGDIVDCTEGFTGADLKRVVEDAKSLYAFDRAHEKPVREPCEYYGAAAALVRQNKQSYLEAQAKAEAEQRRQARDLLGFGGLFPPPTGD